MYVDAVLVKEFARDVAHQLSSQPRLKSPTHMSASVTQVS